MGPPAPADLEGHSISHTTICRWIWSGPERTRQYRPSATAIQHSEEEVSEEIEPHQEALDARIRVSPEVPADTKVLVASMDGANVRLREPGRGRPAERPRSQASDEPTKATFKNAMVEAVSFHGTIPDDREGPERLRNVYSARMPEDCAATFKRGFGRHLEIIESKLDPDVIKLLLCDGRRALRNYADHTERFDGYEKLVDFYRTDEPLSKAVESLFGKNSLEGRRWYAVVTARGTEDTRFSVLRQIRTLERIPEDLQTASPFRMNRYVK